MDFYYPWSVMSRISQFDWFWNYCIQLYCFARWNWLNACNPLTPCIGIWCLCFRVFDIPAEHKRPFFLYELFEHWSAFLSLIVRVLSLAERTLDWLDIQSPTANILALVSERERILYFLEHGPLKWFRGPSKAWTL